MKKRFLSLFLATVILAGATGCGKDAKKEDAGKTAQSTPAEKTGLTIGKIKLDDPKLEEEWKKEPAYGRKLKVNFDGGLCASTLGIAHARGYFAKEGLDTEVVNTPEPKDALATGKIDVMVEHISTTIVPAINGLNIAYTTAVNTGCKTMFVMYKSEVKSTKAHKDASDWVEVNKKEAVDVISANNWGSGNKELDEYFLNAYSFKVSDEQTKKSLTDVVEDYKNFGLIDKNKTADEILGKLWLPISQK